MHPGPKSGVCTTLCAVSNCPDGPALTAPALPAAESMHLRASHGRRAGAFLLAAAARAAPALRHLLLRDNANPLSWRALLALSDAQAQSACPGVLMLCLLPRQAVSKGSCMLSCCDTPYAAHVTLHSVLSCPVPEQSGSMRHPLPAALACQLRSTNVSPPLGGWIAARHPLCLLGEYS